MQTVFLSLVVHSNPVGKQWQCWHSRGDQVTIETRLMASSDERERRERLRESKTLGTEDHGWTQHKTGRVWVSFTNIWGSWCCGKNCKKIVLCKNFEMYIELTLHGWIKYLDLLTGERCVENIQTWEVFGVRHGRYVWCSLDWTLSEPEPHQLWLWHYSLFHVMYHTYISYGNTSNNTWTLHE